MKTIKSISFFFLLTFLVTVYFACNQNGNKKVSDTDNNTDNVAGRIS